MRRGRTRPLRAARFRKMWWPVIWLEAVSRADSPWQRRS
jgi:hypothetical protein